MIRFTEIHPFSPKATPFVPRPIRLLPSRGGKGDSLKSSTSNIESVAQSLLWSIRPRTNPPKSLTVSQTTKSPTPPLGLHLLPDPDEKYHRLLEVISSPVVSGQQTPVMSRPTQSPTTQAIPGPSTTDPGATLRASIRDQMDELLQRCLQKPNIDQVRAFLVSSVCLLTRNSS